MLFEINNKDNATTQMKYIIYADMHVTGSITVMVVKFDFV